ncbi:hypothetical protein L0337_25000 [candidate division KSB1 bacterium]|nr:hypothetical protein [candidate division KSB1 bacterium]
MARTGEPLDELMIVNPSHPKGERYMRLYEVDPAALSGYIGEMPEAFGYYAEAPDNLGCGCGMPRLCPACGFHLAEAPEGFGYFADPPPGFVEGFAEPEFGYYAEAPEFGYYAEAPEFGYYAEAPEFAEYPEFAEAPGDMGYFAESPDFMGYGEPEIGYFAEPEFAEAPEMGYFAEDPGYGEAYPEMGYFAEDPAFSGYMQDTTAPGFSPRVVPVDKLGEVEGYMTPKTINPSIENFRPPEVVSQVSTQWFKSPW